MARGSQHCQIQVDHNVCFATQIAADDAESFLWLIKICQWFLGPNVIPWVGMVAALIAALSVHTRHWIREPKAIFGKLVWVAAVWLVSVLLIGWISSGTGGENGKGNGPTSEVDDEAKSAGSVETTLLPTHEGSAVPESFDLHVSFLPSNADPNLSKPFACKLITPTGQGAEQTLLTAPNMKSSRRTSGNVKSRRGNSRVCQVKPAK